MKTSLHNFQVGGVLIDLAEDKMVVVANMKIFYNVGSPAMALLLKLARRKMAIFMSVVLLENMQRTK